MTALNTSWWGVDISKVGAYIAPNTGTDDASWDSGNAGSAEAWVACATITLIADCNARMYNKLNAGANLPKDRWIEKRIVGIAGSSTWTTPEAEYNFGFNEDIALAANFQSSWTSSTAVTDGSKWCSQWRVQAPKAGTDVFLTVTKGYDKRSKCTFLVYAEDATVAPTFKLSAAGNLTFLLQVVDWAKTSELGTNG